MKSLITVFLWATVTIVLGCMEFISTDTIFLGFSIIMAAQYLHWGKNDE